MERRISERERKREGGGNARLILLAADLKKSSARTPEFSATLKLSGDQGEGIQSVRSKRARAHGWDGRGLPAELIAWQCRARPPKTGPSRASEGRAPPRCPAGTTTIVVRPLHLRGARAAEVVGESRRCNHSGARRNSPRRCARAPCPCCWRCW